jgi:hypothetical protein
VCRSADPNVQFAEESGSADPGERDWP